MKNLIIIILLLPFLAFGQVGANKSEVYVTLIEAGWSYNGPQSFSIEKKDHNKTLTFEMTAEGVITSQRLILNFQDDDLARGVFLSHFAKLSSTYTVISAPGNINNQNLHAIFCKMDEQITLIKKQINNNFQVTLIEKIGCDF